MLQMFDFLLILKFLMKKCIFLNQFSFFYEHIIEQFPEQDLYCCYTYSFKDVSLVEIFQYHLVHDVLCKFLVFVT